MKTKQGKGVTITTLGLTMPRSSKTHLIMEDDALEDDNIADKATDETATAKDNKVEDEMDEKYSTRLSNHNL